MTIRTARATRRMHCWAGPAVAPGIRGAHENTGQKRIWTPGLPSGWRGRFLIVKKRGWPRSEALGATTPRDNTDLRYNQASGPEHVAPVSGPPDRCGFPNSARYRPARVSRENTRDQRRARPGRTAETVGAPRDKKNPRRTLTSHSTAIRSVYDALSESAEHDCR